MLWIILVDTGIRKKEKWKNREIKHINI